MKPTFDTSLLDAGTVVRHLQNLKEQPEPIPHGEILSALIEQLVEVNFLVLAYPEIDQLIKTFTAEGLTAEQIAVIISGKFKVTKAQYLIITIEQIQVTAEKKPGDCARTMISFICIMVIFGLLLIKTPFRNFWVKRQRR